MSNWNKNQFIDHLREECSREVAKVGVSIIDFTEHTQMTFPGEEVEIMEHSLLDVIQMRVHCHFSI